MGLAAHFPSQKRLRPGLLFCSGASRNGLGLESKLFTTVLVILALPPPGYCCWRKPSVIFVAERRVFPPSLPSFLGRAEGASG